MPIITARDPNGEVRDVSVDTGGRIEINESPISSYKLSDLETGGATEYYGYVKADGSWYIMKLTTTAARYIAGTSEYTTNWTNRAELEYDYFYTIF